MKKIALALLFVVLLFAEIYLCSAFLPLSWQLTIQHALSEGHDQSQITHPDLEGEINQALRKHPGFRVAFYGILVLLVIANTFVLFVVWRFLVRSTRRSTAISLRS
ncbi:MAG: hypothetical protein WCG81_00355 [Candidatus Angelobacter sp.]